MKLKVWQVIWGLKDGGAENLAREYAHNCGFRHRTVITENGKIEIEL